MLHIVIISGSVRTDRKSHRVATYFQKFISENNMATSEIVDLKELNLPVMEEQLIHLESPAASAKLLSEKINKADAVILVSPEYNSGYSASVKNAIDLLITEWYRKPVGIVGVSSGNFGGIHAITQLQSVLLKIKAVPISATFPVPNIQDAFDENGTPVDKPRTDKRAQGFVNELLWFADAFRMKATSTR